MRIENPVAFSFLFQDDLYLLSSDKAIYSSDSNFSEIEQLVLETVKPGFNYLGDYKKQFLILVYYPGLEFILPAHLTALENTLKRLEHGLQDVAIVNLAGYPDTAYAQLGDFFKPNQLLIMGQRALPAGAGPFVINQPIKLNNCRALFTFSFSEMMDSNEHKKVFWEQIKKLATP